jgi:hypothetical protein
MLRCCFALLDTRHWLPRDEVGLVAAMVKVGREFSLLMKVKILVGGAVSTSVPLWWFSNLLSGNSFRCELNRRCVFL